MHKRVCVCVVLVNPTLWGQNVPTKMAISKILILVESPHKAWKPNMCVCVSVCVYIFALSSM